jgi:hypothetical protein
MLSKVHVVIDGDIFCGDLNIDGYVIDFIFCIGVRFPRDFLGVVGANDSAGPVIQNTAMDIWRNFERFVYQFIEKPGWVWIPPSLVVLLPFGLYLSLVSQGCRWPLRHQIPCFTGDVMADDHLLQPGRSMSLQHVDALDMRLMVALKNCEALSSGRVSASSCRLLRPPASRSTWRTMTLQGLDCSFIFLERVFVRFGVKIKKFM